MRIAAAQTHPAWLDPEAGTKKAISWIADAASEGVELLAFGETFIGGYPFWLSRTGGARFNDDEQKAAYAAYLEAAVEVGGPEVSEVAEAARDHRVFTYLGIAERGPGPGRGTVYATLLAIDPQRGVVSSHRKLMPTYEERLVWGTGDGHGLRVHPVGDVRVGGLNCWENWMPQARHALYAGGEDLHVAVWPGATRLTRDITRFIALEGRVWVLSASSLLHIDDIPDIFPLAEAARAAHDGFIYDGGSAIAAPDGSWVVEPVASEEGLVVADVDPVLVRRERQNFDPTGHYHRPDVFEVTVHRRRLDAATFDD